MSRHLNSGDNLALSELFDTHFHRNCVVELNCGKQMKFDTAGLLNLLVIANDNHPDSIVCMHSTKVVNNEVHSKLYFKSTDTRTIFESMKRTVIDPTFAGIFTGTRADRLKRVITCNMSSEQECAALSSLAESDADYIVYCQVDLQLQFDESRRVAKISFTPTLTSLIEVRV